MLLDTMNMIFRIEEALECKTELSILHVDPVSKKNLLLEIRSHWYQVRPSAHFSHKFSEREMVAVSDEVLIQHYIKLAMRAKKDLVDNFD